MIAQEGWNLETEDFSSSNYSGVTMANGRIGLVLDKNPFKTKEIILNGVYDFGISERDGTKDVSRIIKGIDFLNWSLKINGVVVTPQDFSNWKQNLNMKEATFTTSFNYKNLADISITALAFRNLPFSAMMEVQISPKKNISIEVRNKMQVDAKSLKNQQSLFRKLKDNEFILPVYRTTAETLFGRYTVSAATTFLFQNNIYLELNENAEGVGFTKDLKSNETYSFALMGGICTTNNFSDALSESERQAIYGITNGYENLKKKHIEDWAKIWTNDIEIEGDIESQKDVRFALYNLFSFIKENSGLSIPPMGLSSQGYNGHIFWDAELWMLPVLLVFNESYAASMLEYRINHLKQAEQKAKAYGFQGAMFPWESDDEGEECTPTWALTGAIEHHITGDVGVACWNFYLATQDKDWLRNKGFELIKQTADFWVSRVHRNEDGSYSINHVVGADEYAQNVNDNAFTNGVAIENLKNADAAAQLLNIPPNPDWLKVANGIRIIKKDGIIQEYDGYAGQKIKQGDVNLLAYPLHVVTDKAQIKRDLDYYYAKVDDEDGPAMAHGVFSVLFERLGETENAFQAFQKSYLPNKRAPFGVLSESAKSNNPYFATGAGAMLQSVIFGFGGIEIGPNGINKLKTNLPEKWKSLTLKGIGVNNETITIKNN